MRMNLIGTVVFGLCFCVRAEAATQTITASVNNGVQANGSAAITTFSTVTCTQASGSGATCAVKAPGTFGTNGYAPLKVGEAVGTTGAGTVVLGCNGAGNLTCTAKIEDTTCVSNKTISASARNGVITNASAQTIKPASVTCTQAAGGTSGTTCGVRRPGTSGINGYAVLQVGQSLGTSGGGDISLGCNGSYNSSGGGLTCSAQVTQVCP